MKIATLEAFKDGNEQFKLILEETSNGDKSFPSSFVRTQLNRSTGEGFSETYYAHRFDHGGIRYLVYFNRNLIGMDLELKALEISLHDYILNNPILFENVVENLIKSKGFTINSLAESVDVDTSIIEKFVTNGELPKGTHGRMLAEKLNISTDELIDISHQRRKDWIAISKKTIE